VSVTSIVVAPGGGSRPGPRCCEGCDRVGLRRSDRRVAAADDGAVTVEAAFAIVGLVSVVLVLSWCLALLGGQLAVGEAARAAVRIAARGEDPAAVAREARRLVADAAVEVRSDGDHVIVEVSREVRPPGVLARWGAVRLRAESVAALEVPS
jgi:hypothetical protein